MCTCILGGVRSQSQGAALSNCPDWSSGKEGHFGQKDTLEASGFFLEGPLEGGGPWNPGWLSRLTLQLLSPRRTLPEALTTMILPGSQPGLPVVPAGSRPGTQAWLQLPQPLCKLRSQGSPSSAPSACPRWKPASSPPGLPGRPGRCCPQWWTSCPAETSPRRASGCSSPPPASALSSQLGPHLPWSSGSAAARGGGGEGEAAPSDSPGLWRPRLTLAC